AACRADLQSDRHGWSPRLQRPLL
ncbi:uncharacterized protein METZ01_LOCUS344589, partial [marine metagenome]